MLAVDRIWRNEGVAYRHHYAACSGGIIPTTDNQVSQFPRGGLFVLVQCYYWKANSKQLEDSNICLPSISQIPYKVWDGIGQTRGDQLAVRECYLAMMALDE